MVSNLLESGQNCIMVPWKKETLILIDAPKSLVLLESGEALGDRRQAKADVGAPCSSSRCSQAESGDDREK